MNFNHLLEALNYHFTLFIVFPLIIGLGLYLTVALRFVQIFRLKEAFKLLTQKTSGEGGISRFGAISSVLAGNFGTGNISGMAVALATGGPGALVWMWVMAFFGASIQYASCILSAKYRKQTDKGEYVGGPMYYLKEGLGFKGLAAAFSLCAIFGAITVGNFAQVNSIILPFEDIGINPLWLNLTIAFVVGAVMVGGIKRLAHIASFVVPIKAFVYLLSAFTVIFIYREQLPDAFRLMFYSAVDFSSFAGGAAGFGAFKMITTGFERGLFATDAGTGIVPILQANTRSSNPVMDGMATLVAPFVVMVVCTATGLVLILTGAFQIPDLKSTNMVIYAFSSGLGSNFGGYIVIASLALFAFTTILAWGYCGEKAVEFLFGEDKQKIFRLIYILFIPIGGLFQIDMIWILADIAITLMLVINVTAVATLSPLAITSSRSFEKIKAADGY